VAKRIDLRVRQRATDEIECQVKVGEGKVREEKLDELVDKFDVQKDLAAHSVIGVPNLTEVDKGVDSREESTVEPAAPLRDEFGDGI
jgi:hypothetical protein